LAQAPEANLFGGSATTSIPIEVPPGRESLTPKLALTYSSGAGPSPYGYGWDLPVGKIQRSTKHGVLPCGGSPYQDDFVLVLPGASVECTLDTSTNRCVPPVEESFLRVQYDPTFNKWDVWDKSGLHYLFGDVAGARVPIFPECYTFVWGLTRVEDPRHNFVEVTYSADTLGDNSVLYPDAIRYGATSTGVPHQFEVHFVWSNDSGFARPSGDQIVNSIGGFAQVLTRLLATVEVRYLTENRLIRTYRLAYDFQSGDAGIARQSFLEAVTLYNGDNHALARADGYPASTTFLYQRNTETSGRFGFESATAYQNLAKPQGVAGSLFGRWTQTAGGNSTTYREIFDMDGDGIADLVDTQGCNASNPNWEVFRGSQQGFASSPVSWNAPPGYCALRAAVGNHGDTFTTADTLDLNGDGVPDLVDARTTPWQVYYGYVDPAGAGYGFRIPAQAFAAPAPYIRISYGNISLDAQVGTSHFHWDNGTADGQDVFDLNGDGLLDLVQPPVFGATAPWTVWFNTGTGFEAGSGTQFPTFSPILRFTASDGTQLIGVYDLNGDGLPDQVLAFGTSWHVYLNTGHRIDLREAWTVPPECGGAGLRSIESSAHQIDDVTRDFFDINGDGLPDLINAAGWSTTNRNWTVCLNRGDGFSPGQRWASPSPVIRNLNDHGEVGNQYQPGNMTLLDVFDMDGDGLVDFVDFYTDTNAIRVYHNSGGAWCASIDGSSCAATVAPLVAPNPDGGHADFLEQIENGIGGTTYIDYRPSTQWDNTDSDGVPRLPFVTWTVTRIEQDDGLCDDDATHCVTDGSHVLSTDLTYGYGLFNPVGREFRGFGMVRSTDGEGTVRTSWFHQDAARKGKVAGTNATDADQNILFATSNVWDCFDQVGRASVFCPDTLASGDRLWARLTQTIRLDTSNYTYSTLAYTSNLAWDNYGNVTHSRKGGTSTTRVDTYTDYAVRDDAAVYMVDKPQHVWVVDVRTVPLEEKWFLYDTRALGQLTVGDVTAVFSWLDQRIDPHLPDGDVCPETPVAVAGTCVATQMEYDAVGNLKRVTDANRYVTDTTYDVATQIYPSTVTNALGQAVATGYDPGCGKLLWQTVTYPAGDDPTAQPRTQSQYDTFCRPQATALPDESLAQPHRQYAYFLGGPRKPTDVRVAEAVAGPPVARTRWVASDELFDALGRHLQTRRDAVVDGKRTTVADATVTYDGHGNTVTRAAPFIAARGAAGGAAPYTAAPATIGLTRFTYDALDRVTQVTNPDGTFRMLEHNVAWQTTAKDECYTAGSCPGGKSIERRDAFGRVREKQAYQGDTFDSRTVYTYDGLGRLLTTTQGTTPGSLASNTTMTVTYDSLGRKIQMSDPDSGTWSYGYDLVGNLIYQDDPKAGQHVELCYDPLNRLTDKFYKSRDFFGPGHCGSLRGPIAYNYDEGGGAALGRLTSVTDHSGGTTRLYDVRGRVVSLETTITPPGGSTTSARTTYTYDVADHVVSMTYPDGEVVKYGYDAVGQVTSMRGRMRYLRGLTYDLFGRPRMVKHGDLTTDTRTYADQTNSFRLTTLQTVRGRLPLLSYSYARYSATGLLTQLNDVGPKGTSGILDNTASFTYDGLGRLTGASGPNLPFANAYAYDPLGNMTLKEGTVMGYGDAAPHTLAAMNSQTIGIAHDANGNRTAKPGATYDYDADDRLIAIDGGAVQFVYDYTGRRAAKIRGTSVTRYYGSWAEAADGSLTKYYFAGGMLIASQRVPNTQLSGLPATPAVRFAGDPSGRALRLVVLLGSHAQMSAAVLMMLGGLLILAVPGRRKPVVGMAIRRGPVIVLIIVFGLTSLPLPVLVRPAAALTSITVMHYHVDHLGSTQLITDHRGRVVSSIRYKPYGQVLGHYDQLGNALAGCSGMPSCREFTGYDTEPTSGLQYAGARFYDPELGMFLTHDPARQFANPYSYSGWNPVNQTDPNGEAVGAFIVAVVIAAVVSAAVNTVVAAAQGASLSQIGQAAAAGAITGAVSVGLGVVASGVSIGLASLAGTLPSNVGLNEAMNALGEVAVRSAVSGAVANAAGEVAAAAGAPSEAVTGISIAAGYGASYVYDSNFISPGGDLAQIEGKGDFAPVSNTATHASTEGLARSVGYTPAQAAAIKEANLAQDQPWWRALANESHFDAAASNRFSELRGDALWRVGRIEDFYRNTGAATHYLQDAHTLGHIFPGTHFLGGTLGAPLRFLIHQSVGGEVFFRDSWQADTLQFLREARSSLAT